MPAQVTPDGGRETRGLLVDPGMENYTRLTVHGTVTGRHAALVNAAAEILDAMAPANVVRFVDGRRQGVSRLNDLVAAVSLDYTVVSA